MAVNPNSAYITDEMWRLWELTNIPGVKLSGIYANKPGYHNTVNANKAKYPNNYSVKLPLDLTTTNRTKARAIDLTMNEKEMIAWTKRMKVSAEDPHDNRLNCVKEFYGTLDGKTVFGLTKNSATGAWRRSSADKTHLWHGHVSIFTAFIANWDMLKALLSVFNRESLQEWGLGVVMLLPEKGDTGEGVKYWQFIHNKVAKTVDPPSPTIVADGAYGKTTASAFADFWVRSGGKGTYDGSTLTGWLAVKYQEALVEVSNPGVKQNSEELKKFVNDWLTTHVGIGEMKFSGVVNGKVSL